VTDATDFRLRPPAGFRLAVVGGCGGIGRRLVQVALASGLKVAIVDLPQSIAAHPPSPDCSVYAADGSDSGQVEAAFGALGKAWGALDGFVNLCGYSPARQPIEALDLVTWQQAIDGNLNAAFLTSKFALPLLRRGVTPSMVQVASSLAVKASVGYGPYSAAKAGMLALVRMLAAENAPGIRVNAVAPSAVRTEFITGGTGRSPNPDSPLLDLDAYGKALPLGRIAEPDDIVGPILFLLGPGSRYMTGQVLHVNGGLFQP
jgi:3-oxoacyl-[acyl-carrier protein] reductase